MNLLDFAISQHSEFGKLFNISKWRIREIDQYLKNVTLFEFSISQNSEFPPSPKAFLHGRNTAIRTDKSPKLPKIQLPKFDKTGSGARLWLENSDHGLKS